LSRDERLRERTFPSDVATTTIAAALLPPLLRFQPSKVFSPPRGRSENHAARPLDRPARSHDSTNIGGSVPTGYRRPRRVVHGARGSRALVIFFRHDAFAEFLERPSRDREFRDPKRDPRQSVRHRRILGRFNFRCRVHGKIFRILCRSSR